MKIIVSILLTILICTTSLMAQSFNKEVTEGERTSLQGKINKEGLSQGIYGEWFVNNYKNYTPPSKITTQLKE